MIRIYRIGPDRAALLTKLQSLTFKQAYSDVHSPEDIEAYCLDYYTSEIAEADLSSQETVCCVGQLNSEPYGYYMVKHQACPVTLGSESSKLKQIYVLTPAYGGRLGRALYEHAIEKIQSAGHKWVWLCVSEINCCAQAFYAKLGFAKVGTGPVLEVGKDKLQSSILVLELRASASGPSLPRGAERSLGNVRLGSGRDTRQITCAKGVASDNRRLCQRR
jgi:ribosomal protein S18 acetylase RimI-like enzyme